MCESKREWHGKITCIVQGATSPLALKRMFGQTGTPRVKLYRSMLPLYWPLCFTVWTKVLACLALYILLLSCCMLSLLGHCAGIMLLGALTARRCGCSWRRSAYPTPLRRSTCAATVTSLQSTLPRRALDTLLKNHHNTHRCRIGGATKIALIVCVLFLGPADCLALNACYEIFLAYMCAAGGFSWYV